MIPQAAMLKVLTPAGPYREGSIVALAHMEAGSGRLLALDATAAAAWRPELPDLPEAMRAAVLLGDDSFSAGEVLTLAFLDPSLARIIAESIPAANGAVERTAPRKHARKAAVAAPASAPAVSVESDWPAERAHRFVALVERLLAVDRLGVHRHSLVARLLLPDRILLRSERASEAAGLLSRLKGAAVDALGDPLLAALMPEFVPAREWLEAVDPPSLSATAIALRDLLASEARPEPPAHPESLPHANCLCSEILRADVVALPPGATDPLIAVLIPCGSTDARLSERLRGYRRATIELFAQAASQSPAGRLKAMASAHPALDEALWGLIGAFAEAFAAESAR